MGKILDDPPGSARGARQVRQRQKGALKWLKQQNQQVLTG